MREYLFRAKLVKNGEWTYGNLRVMPDDTYIITPDETIIGEYGKVYPESVGQYIGRKDKNGTKIFEGDIVDCKEAWWNASGPAGHDTPILEVKFSEGFCGFEPFANYDCDCCVYIRAFETKVIGNIYDNPELLEKK